MIDETEKKLAGITPWSNHWEWPAEHGENSWYELGMNYNSIPYESDMAIIVTSWRGHLKWLKATLTNYRLTGKFVICSYDLPFYAWSGAVDMNMKVSMPRPDVYLLAHAWVHKHRTYDCAKRNGWFWDVRYAQGIIKQFPNFKYVFCTNGDCLWEKPEGTDKIIEILGDGDLMADSSDFNGESGTIHTCSVIYKVDAFHAIFDNIIKKFHIPVIGSRSPEVCLREAIVELGLKETKAPEQPMFPEDSIYSDHIDHYHCYNQPSTWKEMLGFRNLATELQVACIERLEPPPKEYLDFYEDGIYFNDLEKSGVYQYYITGDRRWLFKTWSMNEDSWYNRCHYSLEDYGKEPVYEKKDNEPIF